MPSPFAIAEINSADKQALSRLKTPSSINPAILYVLSLNTEQSRDRMVAILNQFARMYGFTSLETFPWEQLRSIHLTALKTRLQMEHKAPATINLMLCALRGVARQAWGEQILSDHDQQVIKSVKGMSGSRLGKGRSLTRQETKELIVACCSSEELSGIRDAAIIALGLGCGLRRQEIALLELQNINCAERSVSIIGKGNKERKVFPPPQAWDLLMRWVEVRGHDGSPCVFTVIRKGKNIHLDHPLGTVAVWKIIRKRGKQMGLESFSPHDLRRTFATRLLEVGADLDTIREALGHNSVLTTQRYVKNAEERVKRFSAQLLI